MPPQTVHIMCSTLLLDIYKFHSDLCILAAQQGSNLVLGMRTKKAVKTVINKDFIFVASTNVSQWLWPSCSTWTNSSCIMSNPRDCPEVGCCNPPQDVWLFSRIWAAVTLLSFNQATGLSRIARSFPDMDWTHFVFFELGSVMSTSLSSESSTTSTSSAVALLLLAVLKWSFCAANFRLDLVEHFDLVFLVVVDLVEVGLVEAGLVEAGLVEAGLWWLASYNY